MARSTEHIDQLLEWKPGAPQAATSPLAALGYGLRRAARARLLLLFLWLAYALVALGGAAATLDVLRGAASPDEAIASVTAEARAPDLAQDPVARSIAVLTFDAPTRLLWESSPWFLLLYGVLAGGVIAQLHAPRPAPLLAQLGATCGTHFGRFVRLLLVAGAVFVALLYLGRMVPARWADPTALPPLPLLAATLLAAAIVDYARVRAVARDSRSMVLELGRTLRFFFSHLPRVLALEALLLAMTAGAATFALALHSALGMVTSPGTAALVAAQALILALLWIRLAAWAAMLSLYQGLALRRLERARSS